MLAEESIDIMATVGGAPGLQVPEHHDGIKLVDKAALPPRSSPIWAVSTAKIAGQGGHLGDARRHGRVRPSWDSPTRVPSPSSAPCTSSAARSRIMQVYCLKTAALAAWGSITAKLPGGYKSARSMAASLTCEDRHERRGHLPCGGRHREDTEPLVHVVDGRLHGFYLRRARWCPRDLDADHVAEDVQVVLRLQARWRGRGAGVGRHALYGLV